jgi:spore germination protein
MNAKREITLYKFAGILVNSIVGVGVLSLPSITARSADTGAPLSTFLGVTVAFIGLVFIALLGKRFPNQSIIQYSEAIIGRWIARIASVVIIFIFAAFTALVAREFGEVVVTSVLKRTPLEVTVLIMLMITALSARNDMTTFAYIQHFYFPVIIGPALLIIILSLKNADAIRLQPVWGNQPEGMIWSILTVSSLCQVFFILTMVIPKTQHPRKVLISCFWGMFIAGGLYALIVVATISVFGAEETKMLLWPTLELAKMTSLPANILERLDAAFLAVWVAAVFTTLFSGYYFTVHSVKDLFRLRDHKMFCFPLLPFVFVIAMIPENVLRMYEISQFFGRISLLATVAYPGLLWLIAVIRGKKEGLV